MLVVFWSVSSMESPCSSCRAGSTPTRATPSGRPPCRSGWWSSSASSSSSPPTRGAAWTKCSTWDRSHSSHEYHAFNSHHPPGRWHHDDQGPHQPPRVLMSTRSQRCDNCDRKSRDIITRDRACNADTFLFQAPMMRDSDRDFSLPMTCTTKNTGTWGKR